MSDASCVSSTEEWCENFELVPAFAQEDVDVWARSKSELSEAKQKGYKRDQENSIHSIQVKDCHDVCVLRALSYSSVAKKRTYKIEVTLLKTTGLQVMTTKCDCKTGKTMCSHVIGLLSSVAHLKKMGISSVISTASCPAPNESLSMHPQSVTDLHVSKVQAPTKQKKKHKKVKTETDHLPYVHCSVKLPIPWRDISLQLQSNLAACGSDAQIQWLLPASNQPGPKEINTRYGLVPLGSVLSIQQPEAETLTADINFYGIR